MKRVEVRKYGITRIISGERQALDSLFAMNQLWNQLVEIDQAGRESYQKALVQSDEALASLTGQHEALQARIETAMAERAALRARTRSRTSEADVALSAAIRQMSADAKVLRGEIREAKAKAKAAAKPVLEALEAEFREKVKTAVKAAGLWWGHSEIVLTRFEVARSKALKTGAVLRFKRFEGEGTLGVRFTGKPEDLKQSLQKVLDGRTSMVNLRPATQEELGSHMKPQTASGSRRMVLTIRVGSADPETGEVPLLQCLVTLHRELPDDIALKTVTVTRTMHVDKGEWSVCLTFSEAVEEGEDTLDGASLEGIRAEACGVDFSWRLVQDQADVGLRVATLHDGDKARHLTLPAEWLKRMERGERLQSEIDKEADALWTELVPALKTLDLEALEEGRFKGFALKVVRSKKGYVNLLRKFCSAHAVAGYPLNAVSSHWGEYLDGWGREMLRKCVSAHHTVRKARDHRKHLYRQFAADIASRYGLVSLDGLELQGLALKVAPDGTSNPMPAAVRANRVLASSYDLRLAIKQAVEKASGIVHTANAAGKTLTCSSCGHEHAPGLEDLMFTCDGCGKLWDKDANSAANCRNEALLAA